MKDKNLSDEYAAYVKDYAASIFTDDQIREFIAVREKALYQLTERYLAIRSAGSLDAAALRKQKVIADAYQHFADELARMMRLFAQDVGPRSVADDQDGPETL